jgi:beta-galactosidase
MLVMDEAFDCWARGKNSQDYHVWFRDWWKRDLSAMVLRDRNHPSVIMWSIGNEIPDAYTDSVAETGRELTECLRSLDSTRPVTNGIFSWPVNTRQPKPQDADRLKAAESAWNSQDIVGSNYALQSHISQNADHPGRMLVSTESYAPLGRPQDVLDPKNTYVVGDFVWTAQDYLGEAGIGRWFYEGDPTEALQSPRTDKPGSGNPVNHGSDKLYPWRGGLCGSLDLLGNMRPVGRWRNVAWNMGETLAIGVREPTAANSKIVVVGWGFYPTWESWTWPGWEGKPIDVDVYSRHPSVRLYLDGTLIGEKKPGRDFRTTFTLPYQPGTLRAVGVRDNREIEERRIETAGPATAIELTADRANIHSDGQDLSFIRVEITDVQGRLNPGFDQSISFSVTGPATIAGLGSANLKSEELYHGTQSRTWRGTALVVLRSTLRPGQIVLKAQGEGLTSREIRIDSESP